MDIRLFNLQIGFLLKNRAKITKSFDLGNEKRYQWDDKVGNIFIFVFIRFKMNYMKAKNIVITIGREFGSGGRQIGKQLAELLGFGYYDKELIEEASKQSGVCREFLEEADEKAPGFFDYALLGTFGAENVLSSGNFYVLQSKVIQRVAKKESCVIVGRSADYILRNHPNCINIFIYAPEDFRKKNVHRRMNISLKDAEELIQKKDKCRSKFYNFYTDKVWGKADSYHLSIDSSMLGLEESANFLKDFVERRLKAMQLAEE